MSRVVVKNNKVFSLHLACQFQEIADGGMTPPFVRGVFLVQVLSVMDQKINTLEIPDKG